MKNSQQQCGKFGRQNTPFLMEGEPPILKDGAWRGECRNELQAQSKNHIKAVNSSTILTIAHKQQFSGKLCIFQKRFSLKFPKSIIEIEIIGNFTKHF